MIQSIQLVRNIGQFDSVAPGVGVPLRPLTLVYSENGRGKTTLAAILRSLGTGDPLSVQERKRIAAQHPPHIVIHAATTPSQFQFQNGAWDQTLPNLVVFDDVFVDENVSSGLSVQSQHRQNLHELVLGRQAVALNSELQTQIARIEEHNRDLRNCEQSIPESVRGPFSTQEFCGLAERDDIDQAIQTAEQALAAVQEQDRIHATPPFESIRLPAFDLNALDAVLQQDLPALESDALTRVQEHFRTLGDGGESWIADGMRRIQASDANSAEAACPFCGQELRASTLITHYRAYFSQAYEELKNRIAGAMSALKRTHADEAPAQFERAIRIAVERRQFWSQFCTVPEVAVDTEAILTNWRAAREGIEGVIETKRNAPLEPRRIPDDVRALIDQFETDRTLVDSLNTELQQGNLQIQLAKERTASAQRTSIADDLARLRAVKARHDPDVSARCAAYQTALAAKLHTEMLRDRARTALEQHRANVFPGYEIAINIFLERFHAGFRVGTLAPANTRGGPTCTYNILINGAPIPVTGSEPPAGEPSFRNTLSAGDRNTLALACFFASLDREPSLSQHVIVIDDPVSSLDEHRILATVNEIRRLHTAAAQVIVLSHNKPFLCELWENTDPNDRAAVEMFRDAGGSSIRLWDVNRDCITEHDRRHEMLREYLTTNTGNGRQVAESLRPTIEAFCRVAYPELCPPGTLLGHFRDRCQQRLGTPDEVLTAGDLQELRELTDFANRYKHDTNPAWASETINDTELHAFVRRTLSFCRRAG